MTRKKQALIVGSLALGGIALVGGKIYADIAAGEPAPQYDGNAPGGEAMPGTAGVSITPITCPVVGTLQAAESNCVTVVIPPGAAALGAEGYGPNPAEVSLGTTVIWINQDSVPHTVTADDGSFDSEALDPGETFSFQFNEPGDFPYFCEIHGAQSMSGTVRVSRQRGRSMPCPQAGTQPECPPVAIVTPRPTVTVTVTPRPTPTVTVTVTPRPTPTVTQTVTPTPTPTVTRTVTPRPTPTVTRTVTPTPTPTLTETPTPTPTPTPMVTETPTPAPTETPTP